MPEGLESIGSTCFQECAKLEKVTIPSTVKVVEYGTFKQCVSLKEVVLSEGVETICSNAFAECVALEKVHQPYSLTQVEELAFEHCPKMQRLNKKKANGKVNFDRDAYGYTWRTTLLRGVQDGLRSLFLPVILPLAIITPIMCIFFPWGMAIVYSLLALPILWIAFFFLLLFIFRNGIHH